MKNQKKDIPQQVLRYDSFLAEMVTLLEEARRTAARTVNTVMTATYWEIGRRIVEVEQGGASRAEYGTALLKRLSSDLIARFGRGFGVVNLNQMRKFYVCWPKEKILQTLSEKSDKKRKAPIIQTPSEISFLALAASALPLPWSHYVRLLTVENAGARAFYETEALRGGWTVRQLDRQISTLFYERTAFSRDKKAMLKKGELPRLEDAVSPEEEIRDPLVLEFLGLKDEYSETEMEEALIRHLESFLLELGDDFTFVGRQRRLRIDDAWYRVDLVFFHRTLRCLVLVDLKLGRFSHADVGQMHLYLNYAKENWTHRDENPPIGLILCAEKGYDLARYALGGLPNKVLAGRYKTTLPDERTLIAEIDRTRRTIEQTPKKDRRK